MPNRDPTALLSHPLPKPRSLPHPAPVNPPPGQNTNCGLVYKSLYLGGPGTQLYTTAYKLLSAQQYSHDPVDSDHYHHHIHIQGLRDPGGGKAGRNKPQGYKLRDEITRFLVMLQFKMLTSSMYNCM